MTLFPKLIVSLSLAYSALFLSACGNVDSLSNEKAWTLKLDAGGCLGMCKAYTIELKSNGTYTYTGKLNVKYLGSKKGVLNREYLANLNETIAQVDWSALQTNYGSPAEDSQRKEVSYTSRKVNKTAVYYRLEPQELRNLERFIEILIEEDEF